MFVASPEDIHSQLKIELAHVTVSFQASSEYTFLILAELHLLISSQIQLSAGYDSCHICILFSLIHTAVDTNSLSLIH